jgi:hypothetical protein
MKKFVGTAVMTVLFFALGAAPASADLINSTVHVNNVRVCNNNCLNTATNVVIDVL